MNNRKNQALAVLASLGVFTAGSAHAALPAEIGTMLTTLTTDFASLVALLWPVMAIVLGGFILFKWARAGVNKAT